MLEMVKTAEDSVQLPALWSTNPSFNPVPCKASRCQVYFWTHSRGDPMLQYPTAETAALLAAK